MHVQSFYFAHKTSFFDVRSLSWLLKLPTRKETCQHRVQVWFSVENSHVVLCQYVSNLFQSSLVFLTVFCLRASLPFTTRSKPWENARVRGSRDLTRLPQMESFLEGYIQTYDNFFRCFILGWGVLACRGRRGGNGERTRSSGPFPSPTTASLARRLISLRLTNHLFSIIAVLLVSLKTVFFRRGLFQFGARVHRERSTRKGK